MSKLLSILNPKTKFKIDFALVPYAIVLIEISVFAAQLSQNSYTNLRDLILLRSIHTLMMLLLSILLIPLYLRFKKSELNYITLAINGIIVITLGDLLHIYFGSIFGIELVANIRRFGIILIEGALWFPSFLIIAGNRGEILNSFRAYERRLIIATRSRSRTSQEFINVQSNIQYKIKRDLYARCTDLMASIRVSLQTDTSLLELNKALAKDLLGSDLRKLSLALGTPDTSEIREKFLKRGINSLVVLFQQFRILYSSAVQKAPLRPPVYLWILLALTVPLYLYFYTAKEALVAFPSLILLAYILTSFIVKVQISGSASSIRKSSAMIFLVGMLPLVLNYLVVAIDSQGSRRIPKIVTACVLPLTYYISMELFQVLRPQAVKLLQSDELRASSALQKRVSLQVRDEFSKNISHQWAVFIHGKILTRLAATSLKLEGAAKAGETRIFHEAIESLLQLLTNPDAEFESETINIEREVASRLNPWKGLLEVNLYIDEDLKSIRNSRVRDLGEVIEELISNSIRHGKSQSIDLRIVRSGDGDVEVISTDDASNPPPENPVRSGLGTRIFNLASDGRWSITREAGSTVFRLTMGI